jgi:hypothetical protein
MKKMMLIFLGVAMASGLYADPINPFNDRSPQITLGGGSQLQATLDTIFGAGQVNAATDQQEAGMWMSAAFPPGMIPAFVAEFAGFTNKFGIWWATDTAGPFAYQDIFLGASAGATKQAAVVIDDATDTVFVSAAGSSVCGVDVACGSFTDPLITSAGFGFYIDVNSSGTRYFTVDALNPGGSAQALAYQHGSTTNWALGFEDLLNGDQDFDDMIVKIESIKPVPEPGFYGLVALGIGGIYVFARRRTRSSSEDRR